MRAGAQPRADEAPDVAECEVEAGGAWGWGGLWEELAGCRRGIGGESWVSGRKIVDDGVLLADASSSVSLVFFLWLFFYHSDRVFSPPIVSLRPFPPAGT